MFYQVGFNRFYFDIGAITLLLIFLLNQDLKSGDYLPLN
jgi:hypothetical protein